MRIHDPDVVYTDLGLALLGAFLAWRLWNRAERGYLTKAGVTMLAGLASAALFGAIFHAFFPPTTATRASYFAWVPVSLSIVLVSATLLAVGVRVLIPTLGANVRRTLVAAYAVLFTAVALFVDQSYGMIVRFYAPSLLLFLVAAVREAVRTAHKGWWLLSLSFVSSIVAAVLQQARVVLHDVYFDHNALYHVVQAVAIIVLYAGFRHVGAKNPERRA